MEMDLHQGPNRCDSNRDCSRLFAWNGLWNLRQACWSMARSKWIVCILVCVTLTELTDLHFPSFLCFMRLLFLLQVSTGLMFKTSEHVYLILSDSYVWMPPSKQGNCLPNEHASIFWCNISISVKRSLCFYRSASGFHKMKRLRNCWNWTCTLCQYKPSRSANQW